MTTRPQNKANQREEQRQKENRTIKMQRTEGKLQNDQADQAENESPSMERQN